MNQSLFNNRDFVRPLQEAENQFLQVLVTEYCIISKKHGLELHIAFDKDSPTIWLNDAKKYLMQSISPQRRELLQASIQKYFDSRQGNFDYEDKSFPFRFGNGGTLPVVSIEGKDHYCLFFRDSHPMGWNISNGGANNLNDLLHPEAIIERELREELIVVDPSRKHRYVFNWHDAHLRDHPDFALANQFWTESFRYRNFGKLDDIPLPLKWIPSTEIGHNNGAKHLYDSIWVSYNDQPAVHTGYGYLNINAEDFGIEFDRIAKMSVGPNAIFCDGEISDGMLLNRVVGLFEVDRMHQCLDDPNTEFIPDRLFWNGQERKASDVNKIVDSYIKNLCNQNPLTDNRQLRLPQMRFNLCPVTRNIIRRYMRDVVWKKQETGSLDNKIPYDVFLSFGSEDRGLASKVYDELNIPGNCRVFFSDSTINHGPFARQIDNALDLSRAFVIVASHSDRFYKSWVQYEWESFHNDILSGRKPNNTPFVAFTIGIDPNDLPRPFRSHTAVCGNPASLNQEMKRLTRIIRS